VRKNPLPILVLLVLTCCAQSPHGGSVYTPTEGPAPELAASACAVTLEWYGEQTGWAAGTCPDVLWVEPGMTNADGVVVAGETAGPLEVIVVWRPERSVAKSALAHEVLHALEWQRTGDPDHYHAGLLWSGLSALTCQLALLEPVCADGTVEPPTCPWCGE